MIDLDNNTEQLETTLSRPRIQEIQSSLEQEIKQKTSFTETTEAVKEFVSFVINLILDEQWGSCCFKSEEKKPNYYQIFNKENRELLVGGGVVDFAETVAKKIIPKGGPSQREIQYILILRASSIGVSTRGMIHSIPDEDIIQRLPKKIGSPPPEAHNFNGY
jgi:hypothetical protein